MNYKTITLKRILLLVTTLLLSSNLHAQDDLLDMLEDDDDEVHYTFATFKSARVVNAHTVDFEQKGELQFLIQHRFTELSVGPTRFWGLDRASLRLGFEYGITNRWAVGLGRSRDLSTYDFTNKVKLLRQSTGGKNMPISAVLVNTLSFRQADLLTDAKLENKHRFTYIHQLLVARKFGKRTSLQLMPTYYYRNLVEIGEGTQNKFFAMGFAGRLKVSKRTTIVAEYFAISEKDLLKTRENPYAIGVEIETGGHVFQLHFTNTTTMAEGQYFTKTLDQEWRFGFNVSRVFQLKKHKDGQE